MGNIEIQTQDVETQFVSDFLEFFSGRLDHGTGFTTSTASISVFTISRLMDTRNACRAGLSAKASAKAEVPRERRREGRICSKSTLKSHSGHHMRFATIAAARRRRHMNITSP